jgi:hypothetical protein
VVRGEGREEVRSQETGVAEWGNRVPGGCDSAGKKGTKRFLNRRKQKGDWDFWNGLDLQGSVIIGVWAPSLRWSDSVTPVS